jgi:hypothetical protein
MVLPSAEGPGAQIDSDKVRAFAVDRMGVE